MVNEIKTESAPETAKIKKWAEFQHYKKRSPPWIKLQRSILDDFDFMRLPIASKALAPLLWLLASESADGSVRIDPEWLEFRLRLSREEVVAGLTPLINNGFLIVASGVLASCLRDACLEGEGEGEGEGEREGAEERPRKSKRGSRLAQDWFPDDKDLRWAENERADLGVRNEVEKFRDYWIAKTGQSATKLDWSATWRNWIRNAHGSGRPNEPKPRKRKEL